MRMLFLIHNVLVPPPKATYYPQVFFVVISIEKRSFSSFRTGFGNAKIRDTQASTNKKNGINAILTLCLSCETHDKTLDTASTQHAFGVCCAV
jgi:hypothetical protein